MFEQLLKHSLDRITSLEHYYETESLNVIRVSEEGKSKHMLGAMIDDFLRHLARSNEQERNSEQFRKFEKRVSKHIEVLETTEDENTKKIAYRFLSEDDAKKAGNIKEERTLYYQYAEMPSIHGCSVLMMLVTRFEEFISNYLSELYIQFPHKYLDNQQLSFSEISSANIEEIKKNLVLREVDLKMRESYKEWFKIYTSHGMTCNLFEQDLSTLSEIYARRNIFVHNSGVVNPTYLLAVPNSKAKLGEKLSVDDTYMKTAFETVYRIIFLMLIESSKLNKKNEDKYLLNIFTTLFDFMLRGKYTVCEPAYAALSKRDILNTEIKFMSQFDRWICIIAEKGLPEIEAEIKAFDVSALSDLFKLAKELLLAEYDTANVLISKLLTSDEIPSTIVEEWPLFMWYRESEQYKKLKEQLPDKFGLEREEIAEHESDDSEDVVMPEGEKAVACV